MDFNCEGQRLFRVTFYFNMTAALYFIHTIATTTTKIENTCRHDDDYDDDDDINIKTKH